MVCGLCEMVFLNCCFNLFHYKDRSTRKKITSSKRKHEGVIWYKHATNTNTNTMTVMISLTTFPKNNTLLSSSSMNRESRRSALLRRTRRRRRVLTTQSSSSPKGTASFTSTTRGGKKGKSGTAFMTHTVFDYEAKERARSASKWINNWKQNYGPVSIELIGKYIFSIATEACTIGLVLFATDVALTAVTGGGFGNATSSAAVGTSKAAVKAAAAAAAAKAATMTKIRNVFLFFFFAFLALRSRTFSILDASRPKLITEIKMKEQRKRPEWTPPAKVFPVVWISIAFLRSISSILVYEQVGKLFCFPIMCLVLHLSIGDWWNFVTNKEKMLGVSAVGVLFVLSSAWFAIYQYYSVLPTAGFVLMPLGIWLSIATALVWSIWDINKPRMRLWPTKTL